MRYLGLFVLMLATYFAYPAIAAERVVFCKNESKNCENAKVLGRTNVGYWASIDNAALLAKRSSSPTVLYLSLGQYTRNMQGLTDGVMVKAIEKRLQLVGDESNNYQFNELTFNLQEFIKRMDGSSSRELYTLLEAAKTADFLSDNYGKDDVKEIIQLSNESIGEVLAYYNEGRLFTAYEREMKMLARIGGARRGEEVAAVTEAERCYFVRDVSHKDYRLLIEWGRLPHKWRDGVLACLMLSDFDNSPFKDKPRTLLYWDKGSYYEDILELTEAQLEQRLRTRLEGKISPGEAESNAQIALEHAIYLRGFTKILKMAKVPWLPRWNKVIELDTENLRMVIATLPPRPGERFGMEDLLDDVSLALALLPQKPEQTRLLRIRKLLMDSKVTKNGKPN